MKIILLGCCYSEIQKNLFLRNSKRGYQFAAQNFQELLINGFISNKISLNVLTVPPLSTYPFGYKSPFVRDTDFVVDNQTLGRSLGFLNIPFFNKPSEKKAIDLLEQWTQSDRNNSEIANYSVVVYGLHLHLMSMAVAYKKKHPNSKLCIIIPDLPEFMACNRYYKKLGLQKRNISKIYSILPYFDSYVLLSEKMIDRLPVTRPYVVIEGLANYHVAHDEPKSDKKVILYTGALSIRYGLLDLLNAFIGIKDNNYRLWLCGNGDSAPIIRKYMQDDSRIKYLGMKPHDEVVKIQKRATLLVNPRHSNEEFTKFSFPSKTMEYLVSGTPTVMCHLGCIPPEYDEYLFYFEDESVAGMRLKIEEICSMPLKELKNKGESARRFIQKEKSPQMQVKKIIELLNR